MESLLALLLWQPTLPAAVLDSYLLLCIQLVGHYPHCLNTFLNQKFFAQSKSLKTHSEDQSEEMDFGQAHQLVGESKNYQQLLQILTEQKTSGSNTIELLQYLLNFISFADCLKSFSSFMFDILGDIEEISKTINWKHASCENYGNSNKSSTATNEDEMLSSSSMAAGNEAMNLFTNENENDKNLLHLPAQAVMEIFLEVEKYLLKLTRIFHEIKNDFKDNVLHFKDSIDKIGYNSFKGNHKDEDTIWSMGIINYFHHFHFLSSLLSLNSLRLLSSELATMIDWNAPFILEIYSMEKSLSSGMTLLLEGLLSLKNWELLLLLQKSPEVIQVFYDHIVAVNNHSFRNPVFLSSIYYEINNFFKYQKGGLEYYFIDNKPSITHKEENSKLQHYSHENNSSQITNSVLSCWFFVVFTQHTHSFFQNWNEFHKMLVNSSQTNNGNSDKAQERIFHALQEDFLFLFEVMTSETNHLLQLLQFVFFKYYLTDLFQVFTKTTNDLIEYYLQQKEETVYSKGISCFMEKIYYFLLILLRTSLEEVDGCSWHFFGHDNHFTTITQLLNEIQTYLPPGTKTLELPSSENNSDETVTEKIQEQFIWEIRNEMTIILDLLSRRKESLEMKESSSEIESELEFLDLKSFIREEILLKCHRSSAKHDKLLHEASSPNAVLSSSELFLNTQLNEMMDCLALIDVLLFNFYRLPETVLFPADSSSSSSSSLNNRDLKEEFLPASFSFLLEQFDCSSFPLFEKPRQFYLQQFSSIQAKLKSVADLHTMIENVLKLLENAFLILLKSLQSLKRTNPSASHESYSVLFQRKLFIVVVSAYLAFSNAVIQENCSKDLFQKVLTLKEINLRVFELLSNELINKVDQPESFDELKNYLSMFFFLLIENCYYEKENILKLLNYFLQHVMFQKDHVTQDRDGILSDILFASLTQFNLLYNDYHKMQYQLVHNKNGKNDNKNGFQDRNNSEIFFEFFFYGFQSNSQALHLQMIQFIDFLIYRECLVNLQSTELNTTNNSKIGIAEIMMKIFHNLVHSVLQIYQNNNGNNNSMNSLLVKFQLESSSQEKLFQNVQLIHESNLLKFLLTIQSLLELSFLNALVFLEESFLKELFQLISNPINHFEMSLLALQFVNKIYLSVEKWKTIQSSNQDIFMKELNKKNTKNSRDITEEDFMNTSSDSTRGTPFSPHHHSTTPRDTAASESFFATQKKNFAFINHYLAVEIIDLLPKLLKTYKDNPQLNNILMNQSFYFLSLCASNNKYYFMKFFNNLLLIGEGFTIEFLCIKLWQQFEESFQYLYEVLDIKKAFYLISSSTAGVSDELKSKAESSDNSFQENEINLLVLESFENVSVAIISLKIILELLLFAYEMNKINLVTLSKCMRLSLCDPRKVVIRYQKAFIMWMTSLDFNFTYLFPFSFYELFNARQATITLHLKFLVEIIAKYTKYQLSKEDKCSASANNLANFQKWMMSDSLWNETKEQKEIVRRNPLFFKEFLSSGEKAVENEKKTTTANERQEKTFLLKSYFQFIKKTDSCLFSQFSTPIHSAAHSFRSFHLFSHFIKSYDSPNHFLLLSERSFFYDLRNSYFFAMNHLTTTNSSSFPSSTVGGTAVVNAHHKKYRHFFTFKEFFQHVYHHLYEHMPIPRDDPLNTGNNSNDPHQEDIIIKRRNQFLALHILPKEENEKFYSFQSHYKGGGSGGHQLQRTAQEMEGKGGEVEEIDEEEEEPEEENEDLGAAMGQQQQQQPSLGGLTDFEKQFHDLLKKVDDNGEENQGFGGFFPGGGQPSQQQQPQRKSRFAPSTAAPQDMNTTGFIPSVVGGAGGEINPNMMMNPGMGGDFHSNQFSSGGQSSSSYSGGKSSSLL
jgi:hypothetical protein